LLQWLKIAVAYFLSVQEMTKAGIRDSLSFLGDHPPVHSNSSAAAFRTVSLQQRFTRLDMERVITDKDSVLQASWRLVCRLREYIRQLISEGVLVSDVRSTSGKAQEMRLVEHTWIDNRFGNGKERRWCEHGAIRFIKDPKRPGPKRSERGQGRHELLDYFIENAGTVPGHPLLAPFFNPSCLSVVCRLMR
jgi:hypothetical protein